MDNQIYKFLKKYSKKLDYMKVGLLCNQTSYDFDSGKYLFQLLAEKKALKRVFIPEHGLFSELQDQLPLNETSLYNEICSEVEFISLYKSSKDSLTVKSEMLADIDLMLIDIQDTGCRYFTFISTISYIFRVIEENHLNISVCIIDKPNPAGRQVEGTIMKNEFSSFVGIEGLPHRTGLTIGETCLFLKDHYNYCFDIDLIKIEGNINKVFSIQPSPNIPTKETASVYSGQCLFEGTILSEGRGTTKPFEIIGTPDLNWKDLLRIRNNILKIITPFNFLNSGVRLRPLCFIPAYHKYSDKICFGFQLHPTGTSFHSLLYSIILIREINITFHQKGLNSIWREGIYEHGSKKTAIEILLGDSVLLEYINGKNILESVLAKLHNEETDWIRITKKHTIYKRKLYKLTYKI